MIWAKAIRVETMKTLEVTIPVDDARYIKDENYKSKK